MSASRNLGVSHARGRLVSFLDSDDIWLPTRLERYVALIEAHPDAGMGYGPSLYWYSWDKESYRSPQTPRDFKGWLGLPSHQLIPPPEPLRLWLRHRGACLPGMNSLIVRRDAFRAAGGFETAFRGLYEDQVFLSKVAASQPVVLFAEVLDHYRQHEYSCCARGQESGEYHPDHPHPARGVYLRWLEGYLRSQRITSPTLLDALRRELWPYRSRVHMFLFMTRLTGVQRSRRLVRHLVPAPMRRALRRVREFRRRVEER